MPDKLFVQDATTHHNGHSTETLGPQAVHISPWGSLDHPHYNNDVLAAAIGSSSRLLEELHQLTAIQHLSPVGLAVMAVGATTPQDLEGLMRIARDRPTELRTGKGRLIRRDVVHPNSAVVLADLLARGAFQGNAGDMMLALVRLKTDVLVRKALDALAAAAVGSLQAHRIAGFTGLYILGTGGSNPFAEYFQRGVKAAMRQNMEIELRLLPSREEILNRRNARGIIYRQIENQLPDKKLVVVYPQTKRGPQPDDSALMTGLAVITGNGYANSSPDAANLLRMLRNTGCGWVEVKPAVVRLPLASLETSFLFWRWRHLVRPPEGESPGLRIILGKVLELVCQNPEAFHVVVVAGSFDSGEQGLLREAIVSMLLGSRVIPVIATIYPKVEGNVTDYLVADFVSAPQLPPAVTSIFSDPDTQIRRDGLTPEKFLATVRPPDEVREAQEIGRQLDAMTLPAR